MRNPPRTKLPFALVLTTPPPLTSHPAAVYLASLGTGSRRTMREALNGIAKLLTDSVADYLTLDWAALRYKHTAAVRAALIEKYAPATINKMLYALKRVLQEAYRLELISFEDYMRAVDIRSVKGRSSLQGRAISLDEMTALMQVCFDDTTNKGIRDTALLAILRGTGLRRSEVVNLDLKDYSRDTGAISVRQGKGKIDRTVYLPESFCQLVEDWLSVRGLTPGPLLNPVKKGGEIVMRRLTDQAVLFLVQKRATEAGITPISPHDFRRTFCSDLLDAGIDIVTVQKLAGHQDPATTSKYDRRGEDVKKRAVQVLQIPQRKK